MLSNKYFRLLKFAIFFVPLSAVVPIFGSDLWYVQYLSLLSVFSWAVVIALWEFNKPLAILNFYLWFSSIFVAHQHPRSVLCFIQVHLFSLAVYFVSKLPTEKRKSLFHPILLFFILQSLLVVLQVFNLDPFFDNIKAGLNDDPVGFLGSRNQSGLFFAMTLPAVFWFQKWLSLLSVLGMWLSKTTTIWAAAVCSMAVFFFLRWRKWSWIYMAMVALCSLVFFLKFEQLEKFEINNRWYVMKSTVSAVVDGKMEYSNEHIEEVFTCNPLFGYGLGSFLLISPSRQDRRAIMGEQSYEHVHNDYIEALFELGGIGVLIIFLVIGDFFWKFFKSIKTEIMVVAFCCLLTQIISALGIYTVQTAVSGMMMMVFLGIFYGEVRDGAAIKN